jgi:hypothetical protein
LAKDVGLTKKEVHDARQFRDAEARDPGVTKRTLSCMDIHTTGALEGVALTDALGGKGSRLGPFRHRTIRTITITGNSPSRSIVGKSQICAGFGESDCHLLQPASAELLAVCSQPFAVHVGVADHARGYHWGYPEKYYPS